MQPNMGSLYMVQYLEDREGHWCKFCKAWRCGSTGCKRKESIPVVVVSGRDGSKTDVVDILDIGVLSVGELQARCPAIVDNVVNLQGQDSVCLLQSKATERAWSNRSCTERAGVKKDRQHWATAKRVAATGGSGGPCVPVWRSGRRSERAGRTESRSTCGRKSQVRKVEVGDRRKLKVG